MKFNPTTWLLILVALLLGGIVYLTQVEGVPQTNRSDGSSQSIFTFEEKQIQSFTLKTQLHSFAFQKDASGNWQMTEPEKSPANGATIAYLLNLVVTAQSEPPFTVPKSQETDFGFHQPMATLEVKLDNQKTHRLTIGGYNFSRSSLYGQADPSVTATDSLNVLLVSPEFDSAVNRPVEDWKGEPPQDKEQSQDRQDE